MLDVKLFGIGHAEYGGRILDGFPGQQCYCLFCYLLLNRQHRHDRNRLASVFWADYSSSLSRKYLRNTLWKLRSGLISVGIPIGHYLSLEEDAVWFSGIGEYHLDVETFETIISEVRDLSGQTMTHEQAQRMEQAVGLYIGDLLEGIDAEWCIYDRERFGLMYLNALSKLMAFYRHHGFFEHSLKCGERILAYDCTREKVHREMMQLYWLIGDRCSAFAQYKCCLQILREELGILPMRETQALYEQMLHNQDPPYDEPKPKVGARAIARVVDATAENLQSPTEHVLQRLHHLETVIEETSCELRAIEALLHHETLVNKLPSQHSP